MDQAMTRCPTCGDATRPEDLYCEACGAPISRPIAESGPGAAGPVAADVPRTSAAADDDRDHQETAFEDMASISDRGLRRARNEDAVVLGRIQGRGARVMVVCDGVSTSARPAQAARSAAETTLRHLLATQGHGNLELAMREAVAAAQAAVCRIPYDRDSQGKAPGLEPDADDQGPPATTLVAALMLEGRVTLAWVGDSRAYFVGGGEAWQLTHDDTWQEEMEEAHLADQAGAGVAIHAHVLTRWLGSDQEGSPEVSITTYVLPADGCLLLCSDGLWNYAPAPDQIQALFSAAPAGSTPLDLARRLVEFARDGGGADNITVAVAAV